MIRYPYTVGGFWKGSLGLSQDPSPRSWSGEEVLVETTCMSVRVHALLCLSV